MEKMTEEDFDAVIRAEVTDAVSYIDEDVSPERAKAKNYYLGRPFGNEVEGRSQVVSHDVREAVAGLLPYLMKVFCSGENVVEFQPTGQEDVAMAEQATDYGNYVYMVDNPGYNNLLFTFKDALISKIGVQRVTWVEQEKDCTDMFTGLDENAVLALLSDDSSEVELLDQYLTTLPTPDGAGGMIEVQVPMFDVKVTKREKVGRIKIEVIPPEEFLINRRARCISESSIVGHRKLATYSELIELGVDEDDLENLTEQDEFLNNDEAVERSDFTTIEPANNVNKAMQRTLFIDMLVRCDYDGDGVAELRRVWTVGTGYKVVKNEPANMVDFADFTMDPEPHVPPVEASSMADRVEDLQLLGSNIWRTSLDSMAQTVNPRTVIGPGVNTQDALNNKIGAVIRADDINQIRELNSAGVYQQALPMLELIDQRKETRTGISRISQGLDADALKSTAVNAANAIVSGSQAQPEYIARNLANGMAKVFRIMLALMVKHQDQERTVQIRNQWVPIDPRNWNPQMDVTPAVGLGTGTTQEKLSGLQVIAGMQKEIIGGMGPNNPLVSIQQYSNTLSKMVQLLGFQNTSEFVNRLPANFQMPEPPQAQDPNAGAAELIAQVEREKTQAKFQVDMAKQEADRQVKEARLMLDREQWESQKAREQLELQLKAAKQESEFRAQRAKMVLEQLKFLKEIRSEKANEENQADVQASQARQEALLTQMLFVMDQIAGGAQPLAIEGIQQFQQPGEQL